MAVDLARREQAIGLGMLPGHAGRRAPDGTGGAAPSVSFFRTSSLGEISVRFQIIEPLESAGVSYASLTPS
jgi:hypothetical protein